MRYDHAEYQAGYRRIAVEGRTQWNDLFEEDRTNDLDDFGNRVFLDDALGHLDLPPADETQVLEYGCGTGPAACFLARRGYSVHAIDLIPEAIGLARRFAGEQGLSVDFGVGDVCEVLHQQPAKRFDLVVDSYCLQSIVTDTDRARLFAGVRARLEPTAYYLISTAMYEPARSYHPPFRYDRRTGICYREIPEDQIGDDTVRLDGSWYQPYRRHLTPTALRQELTRAGFRVLEQSGRFGGDLVCQ